MALALPDFNLSDERREFRDTLRRFFDAHAPMTEVRRVIDAQPGISLDVWKRACDELGIAGLAIPERAGGQGFGLPELAIALGEAGRCLAPIPLFACAVLAARAVEAVAAAAAVDAEAWLRPIARGAGATLAWVGPNGDWQASGAATEVRAEQGGFRLFGELRYVIDAAAAERFFVIAREPGSRGVSGLGLFAVEADASALTARPVQSLDLTRKLTTLRLDGVAAQPVGAPGADGPALARALEEATALLCAEMVGGMQRVLESAVDYAGSRYQFNRPIGSFQAIKHKCADMLIDFEAARTAADAAVVAAAAGDPERSLLAGVAKAHAGPAYARMATENLQIHGGVGYTWEYDAHLYLRRAKSSDVLLGAASQHHEQLAHALVRSAEQHAR